MLKLDNIIPLLDSLLDKLRINNANQHKTLLTFSIVLFLCGLAFSIYSSELKFSSVQWQPLIIIFFIFMPPTILVNAIRYKITSSIAHNQVDLLTSLNISILSSAANILPLPGGVMVRLANIKAIGNTYKQSMMVIYTTSLLWMAMIFIYSGTYLFYFNHYFFSYILLFTGVAIFSYSSFYIYKDSRKIKPLLLLVITEIISIQIDVIRMIFAFTAIGVAAEYSQASALAVTGVMGSIISIIPAGLGIRELFAAAISTLINIKPEHGYIATSLNRIVGLCFIIPISLILMRKTINKSE